MHQKPSKQDIEKAMQFAKSPQGQRLIHILQQKGGQSVEDAKKQAENGNFADAQKTLSAVLNDAQIQKLLKEMKNGNE
ncbi:MAG: hypothetical protein J6C41_07130 [Oscillospiraceae bacterium]|nr:hypothetical protein [Oscillospiraceae bacterium]